MACEQQGSRGDLRAVEVLEAGVIRILKSSWLVKQPREYRIQRLQEILEEALMTPQCAADSFGSDKALSMLSYGWLSKDHPDPEGFHLAIVQQYYRRLGSDVPEGLFWDFASLPQIRKDSTAAEIALRTRGLHVMHYLYGSVKTIVLKLTRMPIETLRPYDDRGWCFFESCVSHI